MTLTVDNHASRRDGDAGFASGGGPANTLEEMCDLVVDCPHFTPEWTDHGYLVIRNQNIRNGRLDLSNPSYTHRDDYDRRTRRAKPEPGDIIFTREAPMGEVCLLPKDLPCCVGQRQVLLRPSKDVHGPYLFYALQSPFVRRQIFWNDGTGSTVSNVRIPTLKALEIPRLGASERFVADCLRALDDKIDLNRRMGETLEAMARALFKAWFVDFEPVRAKMERRDTGLPAEIEAAFPAALDGRGSPQGWPETKLTDIVSFTRGSSYRSAELSESRVALLTLRSFERGGGYKPGGLKPYTGSFKPEQTLAAGDLVVALTDVTQMAEVIGSPAIVPEDDGYDELVASLDVGILRPLKQTTIGTPFLYDLLSTHRYRAHVKAHCTGTTVLHLGKQALPSYCFPLPTPAVLSAFNRISEPLMTRRRGLQVESRELIRLRNLLLPQLISGQLRVPDAQGISASDT